MKGILAILGRSMEDGQEEDPFETAFLAFRSALKSGDAKKAKRAFRLMSEACDAEEDDEDKNKAEDADGDSSYEG